MREDQAVEFDCFPINQEQVRSTSTSSLDTTVSYDPARSEGWIKESTTPPGHSRNFYTTMKYPTHHTIGNLAKEIHRQVARSRR